MPEIYKLFRDNKDKYFLNLQSDGRLILAENYSNFFEHQFSRRYDGRNIKYETIFDIARDESDQQITGQNEAPTSFNEIIAENKPSKEEIVKSILIDLWSSRNVIDSSRPSITKHEEFFRYFSGRWEIDRVSIYDVKKNMMLPAQADRHSCETFMTWLNGIDTPKKLQSIINQTNGIALIGIVIEQRFDIIVNIISCIRKQYDSFGESEKETIKDCYEKWRRVIDLLLEKSKETDVVDYQRYKTLFSFSDEFEICSMILQSIGQHNYYHKTKPTQFTPCLLSEEQYNEFSGILINRFFTEIVPVRPYTLDTLTRHYYCRWANIKYWTDRFHTYLEKLDNPLIWIYGVFYWFKEEQKFHWNDNVVYYLYNGMDPYKSIESVFGDLLPENIKKDLEKIPSPDVNRGYGFDGKDNQLLMDVKKWQELGENPFPEPEWTK